MKLGKFEAMERILLYLTGSYLSLLDQKCIWHMFGPYLSTLQNQRKHCKAIIICKVKDVENKEKGPHNDCSTSEVEVLSPQ
jgi:hypothetical protein